MVSNGYMEPFPHVEKVKLKTNKQAKNKSKQTNKQNTSYGVSTTPPC